jgi:tetratricopeptide (TPR) repeat protein
VVKIAEVYRRAELALRVGAADDAAQVCAAVLETFPNDLRGRALLGQALLEQGQPDEARQPLELVLELDPENATALVALGVALNAVGALDASLKTFERAYALYPGRPDVRDSLLRLYGQRGDRTQTLPAAPRLAVLRWQLRQPEVQPALDAASQYLFSHPGDVYVQIPRTEALWRAGRLVDAERSCRQLLVRHPRLLKPRLMLGQIWSADPQREAEGIELLRLAALHDTVGTVAAALFRGSPFAPPTLGADFSIDLPADLREPPAAVAAAMAAEARGALAAEPSADDWDPPPESEATDEASAVAPAEPAEPTAVAPPAPAAPAPRSRVGHRPPVRERLLAVSCRGPLLARYGPAEVGRLERRLATAERELQDLGRELKVVFVDDPVVMAGFDAEPAAPTEPAAVKAAIDAVWASLDRRAGGPTAGGGRALLLLGGDEVVPFFRRPNPADDDDPVVPTDLPYAVRAASPGVTALGAAEGLDATIPVGRFPDGGTNLSLLLRQIDRLVELRLHPPGPVGGPGLLAAGRSALAALGVGRHPAIGFAYSTAEWRPVAQEVVSALTATVPLKICPPTSADDLDAQLLGRRQFLYFNLQGVAEGDAWYGQCTFDEVEDRSFLPIALAPDRLADVDLGSPVIFSEAGYGASIAGKSPATSLALRFLSEGAAAFVGSTTACYGGAQLPLTGADRLGHLFWWAVQDGEPLGRALQVARRAYANRAIAEQGYLDAEDQKTLLSFVLFGDPLLVVTPARGPQPLEAGGTGDEEPRAPMAVLYADAPGRGPRALDPRLVRQVVQHLASQCPDIADGALRVQRHLVERPDQSPLDRPDAAAAGTARTLTTVTVRKRLAARDGRQFTRLARVTVDGGGQIIKTLVTR